MKILKTVRPDLITEDSPEELDAKIQVINNIFELGPRPTSAVAAAAASGALGDVQTSPPLPHGNPPIPVQVEPTKPNLNGRAEVLDMPAATSHELIVTIVRMLAEAADRSRLTNADQDLLNKKVEELMAYDSDQSVRDILGALKHAPFQHSALTQRTVEKLRQRY